MTYFGIPIVQSPYIVAPAQVRFPRSKRKRIQKKWRKDRRNWEDRPAIYQVHRLDGPAWVCHPEIYKKLRNITRSPIVAQSYLDHSKRMYDEGTVSASSRAKDWPEKKRYDNDTSNVG